MNKKNRETLQEAPSQSDSDSTAARKRDEAPLITVERFVRSVKDHELGEVFLSCEKLRPMRRMTQEDWQNEYNAWLTAPRG
jgi:hypothetical protein